MMVVPESSPISLRKPPAMRRRMEGSCVTTTWGFFCKLWHDRENNERIFLGQSTAFRTWKCCMPWSCYRGGDVTAQIGGFSLKIPEKTIAKLETLCYDKNMKSVPQPKPKVIILMYSELAREGEEIK